MAGVFKTESAPLCSPYLGALLKEERFWALAACNEDHLVGGLTAHTLPLTRVDEHELLVYDIDVLPAYQRQGVGRRLVDELLAQARAVGTCEVFLLADNEDVACAGLLPCPRRACCAGDAVCLPTKTLFGTSAYCT